MTLAAGGDLTGNNFGETLGSLSGNVFADNNNDGILDGPDFGLAGVISPLKGPTAMWPAMTDANGNYDFTGLPAGTYTIVETQPAQYVTGKDVVGSLGESVGTHVTNQFTVNVTAGANGTGYNFAEIPPADPQGYVFLDSNNNGVFESAPPNNEPGIADVTINMTGTDILGNAVNVTTTTDATGFYQFDFRDQAGTLPLLPGVYTITETPPVGYLNGKLQNGTPPAATVVANQFQNIDLTVAPFFGADYNFGELLPSSLSGYVFVDANNNGTKDPGDMGIAGVTVLLTGTDDHGNAVSASVVTDVNGNFSFQRMRPGTYTLTEVQPANIVDGLTEAGIGVTTDGVAGTDVISGIVVDQNQNGTTFRFGERGLLPSLLSKRLFLNTSSDLATAGPAGSGVTQVKPVGDADPSGYVYLDANNNGIKDPGEIGIAGVQIVLTGVTDSGVAVSETQVTNAAGYYQFSQLQPGVYTVTEVQPTGYIAGQETVGSLGGSLGANQISDIVLGASDDGTGYNFGQRLPKSSASAKK